MKSPLVDCNACKGTGKRKLTKKLLWCLSLLQKHQPCTASELHKLSLTGYHASYFNHLLKRLEWYGLVERSGSQFKIVSPSDDTSTKP